MIEAWPAICTLAALILLLVLIIRFQFQPFAALLLVSLGLGLATGMEPEKVVVAIGRGVGDILRDVAIILALGAMLGRMLEVSRAAEVIARRLVSAFGPSRASWAVLITGFLVGIPVLFNVGFLLLIPIMWRLQRETGQSLLWFVLPLGFSLSVMHSLVPPHPGIVGAVSAMGADMIQTIIFGTLMGVALAIIGWLGPGRWWAKRQFVTPPEHLTAEQTRSRESGTRGQESGIRSQGEGSANRTPDSCALTPEQAPPSFSLSVLIVTLPLLLSLLGFGVKLLADLGWLPEWATQAPAVNGYELYPLADWLRFLGHPTMALFLPTGMAFLLLGARRGLSGGQCGKIAEAALKDVGVMIFLFGAAGGFKQVIQDSGAGEYIASQALRLPLSPVAIAYLVAVLMRIALGSATAAILTASALLAGLAKASPEQATLLVLAVANGVTFMTQPADSGFWLVKEYCNLSVKDVMIKYNACRIVMSLTGLAMLLAYEAWRTLRAGSA